MNHKKSTLVRKFIPLWLQSLAASLIAVSFAGGLAYLLFWLTDLPAWMTSWWFAFVVVAVASIASLFANAPNEAGEPVPKEGDAAARHGNDVLAWCGRAFRGASQALASAFRGIGGALVSYSFSLTWVCLSIMLFLNGVLGSWGEDSGVQYDPNSSGVTPSLCGLKFLVLLIFMMGLPPLMLYMVMLTPSFDKTTKGSSCAWGCLTCLLLLAVTPSVISHLGGIGRRRRDAERIVTQLEDCAQRIPKAGDHHQAPGGR